MKKIVCGLTAVALTLSIQLENSDAAGGAATDYQLDQLIQNKYGTKVSNVSPYMIQEFGSYYIFIYDLLACCKAAAKEIPILRNYVISCRDTIKKVLSDSSTYARANNLALTDFYTFCSMGESLLLMLQISISEYLGFLNGIISVKTAGDKKYTKAVQSGEYAAGIGMQLAGSLKAMISFAKEMLKQQAGKPGVWYGGEKLKNVSQKSLLQTGLSIALQEMKKFSDAAVDCRITNSRELTSILKDLKVIPLVMRTCVDILLKTDEYMRQRSTDQNSSSSRLSGVLDQSSLDLSASARSITSSNGTRSADSRDLRSTIGSVTGRHDSSDRGLQSSRQSERGELSRKSPERSSTGERDNDRGSSSSRPVSSGSATGRRDGGDRGLQSSRQSERGELSRKSPERSSTGERDNDRGSSSSRPVSRSSMTGGGKFDADRRDYLDETDLKRRANELLPNGKKRAATTDDLDRIHGTR